MMSKPLYIPSRIFFVLFFFSRSRHRCRLYTCKICTFYMPFFSLLHFLKGKMLPEHFEFRQDIHYFRAENGRNWSGKRWVFGVFQWILPSMRLVHLCLQTTSFGKRKVPVRAFDSNCAVTHIGLVKTLRHTCKTEWQRKFERSGLFDSHMLTKWTPYGCVATSLLKFWPHDEKTAYFTEAPD